PAVDRLPRHALARALQPRVLEAGRADGRPHGPREDARRRAEEPGVTAGPAPARHFPLRAIEPGCVLALVVACFGPVPLNTRQFSPRYAGEFYYPLYQRVQEEWRAGRWPLWEPGENGGVPLLGNPSAAVLYPGKLVYALPYAWAARVYVVMHVVVAFAAM